MRIANSQRSLYALQDLTVQTRRVTRILVVDDEPYLADLVATALRYEGFETATAASGAAAVTATENFRPDLIVLDVILPDILGTEVCRKIRTSGSNAPIVFLTA